MRKFKILEGSHFKYEMFIIVFSLATILLFGNVIGAEKVLYLDLKYNNETGNFYKESLYVNYGKTYIPKPSEEPAIHKVIITNEAGEALFRKGFSTQVKYLDIPSPENVTISLSLPYKQNYRFIKVIKGEKVVLFIDLKNLCNKNDRCDKREDFFSCPEDCSSGSEDGVCDKVEDGICDPDCTKEADPDCIKETTTTSIPKPVCGDNLCESGETEENCPEDCKVEYPSWLIWIVIGIIIIIIGLIARESIKGE